MEPPMNIYNPSEPHLSIFVQKDPSRIIEARETLTHDDAPEFEFMEYEHEEDEYNEDADNYMLDGAQDIIDEIYESLLPIIVENWINLPSDYTEEMDEDMIGKVLFKNGNVYEGNIINSRFHGKGVFIWADGARLDGYFYRNYARGIGKYINSNEDYYNGNFSQGVSSHGVSNLKTKYLTYIGSFLNGLFHGKGVLKAPPLQFNGEFAFDLPLTGIRQYETGTFVGEFCLFGYRKYGKFVFNNNDLYYGIWSDDKYNDFGVYQWSYKISVDSPLILRKQTYYSGFWIQGNRNGIGLIRFDDIVVVCKWKLDKKEGCGLIRAANGNIIISNLMFKHNQYREGMKLKLNDETKAIVKNLLDFPNSFDGRNDCHLTEPKTDDYMQCKDMFKLNICKLLTHANEKIDYTPYFISNYLIDKELPCVDYIKSLKKKTKCAHLSPEIELKCLRQTIQDNFFDIKTLYLKYANFNKDITKDDITLAKYICMNRLGLWLLYRDVFSNMPRINIMDNIELCENLYYLTPMHPLDPNEPVYFWEFLRHLFNIIVILNKKNCTIFEQAIIEKPSVFGLFSTMFLIFLREFSIIHIQESLSWKMLSECPDLIIPLLDEIRKIQYDVNISEAYKFYEKIKSVRDKRVKKKTIQMLEYITDDIFIECCTIIFPIMMKNRILVDICFKITPLQLCEIIFVCFEKQILQRKILEKMEMDSFIRPPTI